VHHTVRQGQFHRVPPPTRFPYRIPDLLIHLFIHVEQTPLTELTSQLYLLPHLRSFALTKGHRYADEAMLRSALRVYRAPRIPPHLAQVSICWARAKCRNHLKQEGQYDLVHDSVPGKTDDLQVIEVWECGLRAVGGVFDRRSRYVLGSADGDA
jgi:hypothetical protein